MLRSVTHHSTFHPRSITKIADRIPSEVKRVGYTRRFPVIEINRVENVPTRGGRKSKKAFKDKVKFIFRNEIV
jgi:hypothetical protein